MHARIGFAALYVTHDQEEALSLATRIAVLHEGEVVQIGTPTEIYDEPATRYVAEFVGRANIVECTIAGQTPESVTVSSALGVLTAPSSTSWAQGQSAYLIVRPEDVALRPDDGDGSETALRGEVVGIDYGGASSEVDIALPGGERVRALCLKSHFIPAIGAGVALTLDVARARVVDR
ncbi:TOBE domain-containing protein [Microbacterium esteraromaticum]|uniref:TOBE domain-containing protein n=1 Tax=Microbacterium esteraromaticum TaxID=57043 RepID=A0A7D7WD28_9MICO|nr:TOBE domain-containing protein [Microbacterium esteraromaticum]QMU97157.1 TOBE domain-containing protein [Microbacterium esteraromaticum]